MPTIRPATVLNMDGEDMKVRIGGTDEKPVMISLTLGFVMSNCLNARDEEKIGFDEMYRRGELIHRVQRAERDFKPLDIEPDDVVLVHRQLPKTTFGPTVAFILRDLLDPKEKSDAGKKKAA